MPKKNKSNSNKRSHKTKSGAASFYIIIFTTILFGIITLSFIRIILSESSQTSNNDLSQSAYDSALAGIEDAKIAILDYHKCISKGYSKDSTASTSGSYQSLSGEQCTKYISIIQEAIEKQDCDTTLKALKRHSESEDRKEVLIQETQNDHGQGTSASTDLQQAYTCVKIREELPDYRSILDSENRTRIVPIRTKDHNSINRVKFSWYSSVNVNAHKTKTSGDQQFHPSPSDDPYAPPVVAFQLLQTNSAFGLHELSATNVEPSGSQGVNRSTIFLRPQPQLKDNPTDNIIKKKALLDGADKSLNEPINVECSKPTDSREFLCSASIELPRPAQLNNLRNDSSFFVRVSLPYGTPATDFSIELEGTDAATNQPTPVNFYGVQTAIDSTGRANDLYRRVESRVELVDTHFPYPEFAIEILDDGDSNKVLKKNFRITKNCWTSGYDGVSECPNNEELE